MQRGKRVVKVETIDGLDIFVDEVDALKFEEAKSQEADPSKVSRQNNVEAGQQGGGGVRRMKLGGGES